MKKVAVWCGVFFGIVACGAWLMGVGFLVGHPNRLEIPLPVWLLFFGAPILSLLVVAMIAAGEFVDPTYPTRKELRKRAQQAEARSLMYSKQWEEAEATLKRAESIKGSLWVRFHDMRSRLQAILDDTGGGPNKED